MNANLCFSGLKLNQSFYRSLEPDFPLLICDWAEIKRRPADSGCGVSVFRGIYCRVAFSLRMIGNAPLGNRILGG